jgi:hypothetical protein
MHDMTEGQIFWNWLVANIQRLETIEELPQEMAEPLLSAIQAQLDLVAEGLYFEFSVAERPYEFVITADGDTALFPAVRSLVRVAPEVPGWTITAFKQAQEDLEVCEWDDTTIELSGLRFQPLFSKNDPDRIALRFLIDGETSARQDETIAALDMIVGTLLGEETAATVIAHIEIREAVDDPENYAPVHALPGFIRQYRS